LQIVIAARVSAVCAPSLVSHFGRRGAHKVPNYAYDLGGTDTSVSFEKLRDLSKIHDKAARADADPQFSARIREGVPVPH
jgi:hypothetical protein